jgi:hypothetical protein
MSESASHSDDRIMGYLNTIKRQQYEKIKVRDYLEQKRLGKLGQTITSAVGEDNLKGWTGRIFDFGDEESGKFRVEFGSVAGIDLQKDSQPLTVFPRVSIQIERNGEYTGVFYIKLNQDPSVERKDLFLSSDAERSLTKARACAAYFDTSVVGLAEGLTEAFESSVPIEPVNAAELLNA